MSSGLPLVTASTSLAIRAARYRNRLRRTGRSYDPLAARPRAALVGWPANRGPRLVERAGTDGTGWFGECRLQVLLEKVSRSKSRAEQSAAAAVNLA
jgi:hypothetical protein